MKSLELLDELVSKCQSYPYPDVLKDALTLRAQFVLDVAPYRELAIFPPLDEIEPE